MSTCDFNYFILIFAYCIRFLTVYSRTIKSGLDSFSLATDDAAKTLGANTQTILKKIHFPMLKTSLLTGFLIVFIDIMKELPMTILLRPFNFETLATYTYQFAHDELIEQAALPALLIIIAGLIPVIFLNKFLRESKF